MENLLLTVAKGLVNEPEKVSVTVDEPKEDGTVVYHIHVAEDDMGRIIGKQASHCKGYPYSSTQRGYQKRPEGYGGNRLILKEQRKSFALFCYHRGKILLMSALRAERNYIMLKKYLEAGKIVGTHGIRGK